MSNKNFNHNDNESFMEGIYGCLERIETGIIELQKVQPNEGNAAVLNVDNTALVQELRLLLRMLQVLTVSTQNVRFRNLQRL